MRTVPALAEIITDYMPTTFAAAPPLVQLRLVRSLPEILLFFLIMLMPVN
jgi:hypothetical protein